MKIVKGSRNSFVIAIRDLKKKLKIGYWLGCPKKNRHLQLSFLDNVPHHRAGGTNITLSQQERDVNDENGEVDEQEQDSNTILSINNTEQSNTGQEIEVCTEATEKVPNVVIAITPKKGKKKEDTLLTL